MNSKTKEGTFIFPRCGGCAYIPTDKEELTDQFQWKTVVSNFNAYLDKKYPLKTKAVEPTGLSVK